MASTSRSVLGLSTLRLTTSSASASRTYARPLHSSSSLRLADGDSSSSDAPTTSPGPARSNRTPSQSNLEQDAASSPSPPPKSPPSQQNRFQSPQAANNPTGAPPTRFDDLSLSSFPRFLDSPHPILDAVDYSQVPLSRKNPYGSSVSIYNDTKHFKPRPPSAATLALESGEGAPEDLEAGGDGKKRSGGRGGGQSTKPAEAATIAGLTPLTEGDVMGLHRQVLQTRRVVRQSGKGKIQSMAALIVVGDGRGMVGFGQGKAANAATAVKKAFRDAVGAMDFVERFEGRTIQRSVVGEWGATKVHLRPRPPGFGLRCPPSVHVLASSCGISDLSASITGSTNPLNVCRAVASALCGGANPVGLGDGLGGSARRSDLGQGVKTIRDLEVERGRRLREVRV